MQNKNSFNSSQWNDNSIILTESRFSKIHRRLMLDKSLFHSLVNDNNKKILDLGCGSGAYLKYFASRGYKQLFGIEPDTELIKRIPGNIAEVKVGIAERIPFGDNSFDAVFVYGVLHHMPTDKKNYIMACDEMLRILKPGGHLFIMEPGRYSFFRMMEIASKMLGMFSRTFKAFSEALDEEKTEQHFFIKNHNIIRERIMEEKTSVIVDKYFIYSWVFTLQKR
jgi:SAM-dependent methyltransferase